MRLIAIITAMFLAVAWAGETVTDASNNLTSYSVKAEVLDDALQLICWDAGELLVKEGEGDYNAHSYSQMAIESWGTDSVLYCSLWHLKGDPYFFPGEIDYVARNLQFTPDWDQYHELQGDFGRIRPGGAIIFLLVLDGIARGEPFTLYYGDDSIEITLKPLDEF